METVAVAPMRWEHKQSWPLEFIDAEQGTDAWLAARKDCDGTASEAAAMMGHSKNKSRNDLLLEKKTGISKPVTAFMQELFDKGHWAEEAQRPLASLEMFQKYGFEDDLLNLVAKVTIGEPGGGPHLVLLASYDGLIMLGGEVPVPWEHKLWNKTLPKKVRAGNLGPEHYWQLEHQMLVVGADHCYFCVSDGTKDNRETMIYVSEPNRRDLLIRGWLQFKNDLNGFEVKAVAEPAEQKRVPLPVFAGSGVMEGTEVISDLDTAIYFLTELAEIEKSKVLETDQEFADKALLVKEIKKARDTLKKECVRVKSLPVFHSLFHFEAQVSDADRILQKIAKDGDSSLAKKNKEVKDAIIKAATEEIHSFVLLALKPLTAYGPRRAEAAREAVMAESDWVAVLKHKRTLKGLEDAASEEVARVKTIIPRILSEDSNLIHDNALVPPSSPGTLFVYHPIVADIGVWLNDKLISEDGRIELFEIINRHCQIIIK